MRGLATPLTSAGQDDLDAERDRRLTRVTGRRISACAWWTTPPWAPRLRQPARFPPDPLCPLSTLRLAGTCTHPPEPWWKPAAPRPGTAEHIAALTGITVVELDLPAALTLAHAPSAPPTLLPSLRSGVGTQRRYCADGWVRCRGRVKQGQSCGIVQRHEALVDYRAVVVRTGLLS